MDTKWVLMTNDDGIDAPGFEMLVKAMNKAGIPLVAFAPSGNKSACSMQLNLGKPIDLHNRRELIQQWDLDESIGVHLFALDGTPCDTMIVALDGGLNHVLPDIQPSLVLSGVNLGPNLSQDSYHSGTMGAAREAGLYGIPAIASSYTSFDPEGMKGWDPSDCRTRSTGPPSGAENTRKPLSSSHRSTCRACFLMGQILHLSVQPLKLSNNS